MADVIDIDEHINKQIADFRRQLLGLTLRNPLLSCPHEHTVQAQIRIVDELPDAVFAHLDSGDAFEVAPLPEPRNIPDDEDDEEFEQALSDYKTSSLTYKLALKQLKQSSQGTAPLEKLKREAHDYVRLLLERGKWEPEQGLSSEDLARRHEINPSYELHPPIGKNESSGTTTTPCKHCSSSRTWPHGCGGSASVPGRICGTAA